MAVSGPVRVTVWPLFPYSSGYEVWTGDCADADPSSFTGGSRAAAVASNPGATTSGSAALDAVNVVVRRLGGAVVSNATISAAHAPATGCTAGETLTTTTRTNSSGQLRLALPYGTWTIRAVSGLRTGTATVVLDPVSTTVPTLTVVVV